MLVALLFLLLSLLDYHYSILAFRAGVEEGNPFLALCVRAGVFTPVKLGLSILLSWGIYVLWQYVKYRTLCISFVVLMLVVFGIHLWGAGASRG